MGNLCGKSSTSSDAFAQPGRTLDSAPPPQDSNSRTPIPNHATKPPPRAGGPDRTLGGSGAGGAGGGDAREQAARAAEARAQPRTKGQLSQKLAEQKRQTGNQALQQASREERGARDQDMGAVARANN